MERRLRAWGGLTAGVVGALFALWVWLVAPGLVAVWIGVPIAVGLGATMAPRVVRDNRFHPQRVVAMAGLCTLLGASCAALLVAAADAWSSAPGPLSPFAVIDGALRIMVMGLVYLGPHAFLALLVPASAWLWLVRRVAR